MSLIVGSCPTTADFSRLWFFSVPPAYYAHPAAFRAHLAAFRARYGGWQFGRRIETLSAENNSADINMMYVLPSSFGVDIIEENEGISAVLFSPKMTSVGLLSMKEWRKAWSKGKEEWSSRGGTIASGKPKEGFKQKGFK